MLIYHSVCAATSRRPALADLRRAATPPNAAGWQASGGYRIGDRGTECVRAVSSLEPISATYRVNATSPDAFFSHNPDLQARPSAWRCDPGRAGANVH